MHTRWFLISILIVVTIILGGCFGKVNRIPTNYYVLDYQSKSELPELKMMVSSQRSLVVMNSVVNRTYNRNQLVMKENFYKVRFLNYDLWANRLSDAIPNIIAQRLRAYNIFSTVSRDTGEVEPNYYLETNVLNIEKIVGASPKAYLKMEFVLRDSTSNRIVFVHRNERYHNLTNDSMVYLVQVFNDMIMQETNTFAALCIMHFSGKAVKSQKVDYMDSISAPELYYYKQMEENKRQGDFGELLLTTNAQTSYYIPYLLERLDDLNTVISEQMGELNEAIMLEPGRYRITTGHNIDIVFEVEVHADQITVVEPIWSELKVRILDLSQTRVRQIYDLWKKNPDDMGYEKVGQNFSVAEEEHGMEDRLWILPEGNYMITLGGYTWSDLREFCTVELKNGQSQVLSIIVDPAAASFQMVGAGVLADDMGVGAKRLHKGAIYGNVNLSSDNEVDQKSPTISFNLAGQFDNTIDYDERPFHYNLRSIYDLGANVSSDKDFRINLDKYSLKNVMLLYPWGRQKKFLNNFAFYGRADANTHFWDEYTRFSSPRNVMFVNALGDTVSTEVGAKKIRTKIALYPLRLKQGAGMTYRIAFSPNTWVSLRGGYGWQQTFNLHSYSYKDTVSYQDASFDRYVAAADLHDNGLETTLTFSSVNILNFLSLNSTVDALFPVDDAGVKPRIDSENRINFRIYRNLSMDVRVNLQYDEAVKPWWVYNYSTYLRMSLFY